MPEPLLVDLPLARRIEGALAADLVAFARARAMLDPASGAGHLAVAGGVAVWTGQFGSRGQGLGLDGPISDADLDRVAEFLAPPGRGDGGPAEIELCPLAADALAGPLDRRPHRLHGFRNVYAALLPAAAGAADASAAGAVRSDGVSGSGLAIEPVQERLAVWSRVLLDGFGYPPGDRRDRVARWNHMMGTVPEATLLLASLHGEPVGASSVLVHDRPGGGRVASLGGTTTLVPYRRRGVQLALLRHRLSLAAAAGCDLAVVTADPGSSSGRNARRAGFTLAYTNVRVRLGEVPHT